jgi:hypothetical protein
MVTVVLLVTLATMFTQLGTEQAALPCYVMW